MMSVILLKNSSSRGSVSDRGDPVRNKNWIASLALAMTKNRFYAKYALFILLAISLTGCVDPERFTNFLWKPKPAFIGKAPENATPEYKKGWKEGCESGLATYSNYYYKTFYHFTHDPKLLDHPKYSKAWTDSFNYCRAYVNRYLAGGFLFGEGFNNSDPEPFGNRNLRFTNPINEGGSIWLIDPIDPPGWGKNAWGANVEE